MVTGAPPCFLHPGARTALRTGALGKLLAGLPLLSPHPLIGAAAMAWG